MASPAAARCGWAAPPPPYSNAPSPLGPPTTRQAQHIDTSLPDVASAILPTQPPGFPPPGQAPTRQGTSHPSVVPSQAFPTQDGAMLLAIGNDDQFARFCAAAGQPQWASDARFASN